MSRLIRMAKYGKSRSLLTRFSDEAKRPLALETMELFLKLLSKNIARRAAGQLAIVRPTYYQGRYDERAQPVNPAVGAVCVDNWRSSDRSRETVVDAAKLSRRQSTFSRMFESNTKEGVEVTKLV
jgi:hypothetical protein